MDSGWTFADVWMLRSIGGRDAASGATVRQIIGAADHLNHAIPDEDEFTGAVARLTAAGLAGCDPAADRCWLTAAGHASPAQRGTFAAGLAALAALPPPGDVTPVVLPPGAYTAAVRDYLGPR